MDSVGVMTDARIVYASPDNLYLATERWADRPPPATPTEPQPRTSRPPSTASTSPTRPARATAAAAQVSGYLLNQWSLSEYDGVLRVVSTDAPAWFDSSDSTRVVADDAAPRRRCAQPGRPRRQPRQGRARLRGPLRRRRPRTSSRSSRSTRSTPSTSPTRRGRACSASSSSRATRPTCTRSATTCCSGSGRTSTTRAGRPARSSRSSTSPTSGTRRGWLTRRSVRAGPRRSPTTMPSSSGRRTGLVVVPFDQRAVGYRVGRAHGIAARRPDHAPRRNGNAAAITRSVVVGDSVFTISDAGVASSSLATLAPRAGRRSRRLSRRCRSPACARPPPAAT